MQWRQLRSRWPNVRRIVGVTFLLLVAVLIAVQARKVDWPQVMTALRGYRAATLLQALLCALLSYIAYGSFDLIGRRYAHTNVSALLTMRVAAVSYAFNQNFGYLVGGIGFRFRLYSGLGLSTEQISRIAGLSVITNWLGYSVLSGCVFVFGGLQLPAHWSIGAQQLRVFGSVLLLLVAGYLLLALRRPRLRFGVVRFAMPDIDVAVLQLLLAVTHWSLTAAVIWTLLPSTVTYPIALATLLLAAIAAVVTHIPAGLGVLEAVFLALLTGRVAAADVLAAVLAFRAIYHLLPLSVAGLWFLSAEAHRKRVAA